jgi:hypothetical protein
MSTQLSESLSDGIAGLRDHLPSRDDFDVSAITDHLPSRKSGKSSKPRLLVALLGLAGAAAAIAVVRRKRGAAPAGASIYTPPLPKP